MLGRAPANVELGGFSLSFVNGTESLQTVANVLATSFEGQNDIKVVYMNELGRQPDGAGFTAFDQYLAAGGSVMTVRAQLATSAEAQSKLSVLYQTGLGRAIDGTTASGLTKFLAAGGSLATVQAAIAVSGEASADIATVYQTSAGHAPNAVELSAGQSELASGIPLATLQAEIGQLAGAAPAATGNQVTITPEPLGASFIYSLNNNDALIASSQATNVSIHAFGGSLTEISKFNAATDVIQLQSSQVAGYSNLHPIASGAGDGFFFGNGAIDIDTVTGTLTAANFRFV